VLLAIGQSVYDKALAKAQAALEECEEALAKRAAKEPAPVVAPTVADEGPMMGKTPPPPKRLVRADTDLFEQARTRRSGKPSTRVQGKRRNSAGQKSFHGLLPLHLSKSRFA
jgi:hypothetical protein